MTACCGACCAVPAHKTRSSAIALLCPSTLRWFCQLGTSWHRMSASRTLHTYRFAAMGTVCTLHIYAADEVKASTAFASAAAEVERIERKYSRYDPHSLVSKINRAGATAGSVDIDDETSALIDYAFTCY